MPRTDPEERRRYARERYAERMANDPVFYAKERARINGYFKTEVGKEKNRESSIRAKDVTPREYHRFNMADDSDSQQYVRLVRRLCAEGVSYQERFYRETNLITVTVKLSDQMAAWRKKAEPKTRRLKVAA